MPTQEAVNAIIDTWFAERIACGPIARFTPAYNQALEAKDDLKARIAALFAPERTAPSKGAAQPQPEPPADAAAQSSKGE